jgi:hypothetical protein
MCERVRGLRSESTCHEYTFMRLVASIPSTPEIRAGFRGTVGTPTLRRPQATDERQARATVSVGAAAVAE